MVDFSNTDNLSQRSNISNSLTSSFLFYEPIIPMSVVDDIHSVIGEHDYGIHSKQEAYYFNKGLYNHLHCNYPEIENNGTNVSEKNEYFNSLTKEEIEQQKKI